MAKSKRFKVQLFPASQCGSGMISVTFAMDGRARSTMTGEAATVGEIVTRAKAFGEQHGKPCYILVSSLDKPKPRGFAGATKWLYANLDKGI